MLQRKGVDAAASRLYHCARHGLAVQQTAIVECRCKLHSSTAEIEELGTDGEADLKHLGNRPVVSTSAKFELADVVIIRYVLQHSGAAHITREAVGWDAPADTNTCEEETVSRHT